MKKEKFFLGSNWQTARAGDLQSRRTDENANVRNSNEKLGR